MLETRPTYIKFEILIAEEKKQDIIHYFQNVKEVLIKKLGRPVYNKITCNLHQKDKSQVKQDVLVTSSNQCLSMLQHPVQSIAKDP